VSSARAISISGRPGGVGQQLAFAGGFLIVCLVALIVLALKRLRPQSECFTCGRAAKDARSIGTFSLRVCSDECLTRALVFWRAMAEVRCQNLLQIDERDMRGAMNKNKIDHKNFSRMLWEGARQLKENRLVLYRWTIPVEM
jgi:hypothetical protein